MTFLRILPVLAPLLLAGSPARAILSGTDAAWADSPWIAGVARKDVLPGPGLVGGGALVGDQWVVTAAHSVAGLSPEVLEIWLGTADLADSAGRSAFGVLAIYRHPDFSTAGGASVGDVALLLLDRRAAGFPALPLVESESDLAVGDFVRVAGWGTATAGVSSPTRLLQEAPARILSPSDAAIVFGSVIGPGHLPAVDPAGAATPCVGDSGGPLLKSFSGQDRLAGLVSFGTADCGDATKPTIYARIPYFAAWLGERLALTAADPSPSLFGKGRAIAEGRAARSSNATDFGILGRAGAGRTRTFRLANRGAGLLTVRSASVGGRGFSLRKGPSALVPGGGATTLRIRFRHPGRGGRFAGRLLLRTNDPADPASVYRLSGRTR